MKDLLGELQGIEDTCNEVLGKREGTEKGAMETMTTAEVASVLHVTPRAINSLGKRLFNKATKRGTATRWTEVEVTLMRKQLLEHPSNNGNLEVELPSSSKAGNNVDFESPSLPETSLTKTVEIAEAAKQFADNITENNIDQALAAINAMQQVLIEKLQAVLKEREHQLQYDKVKDCKGWREVKKWLGIKDSWSCVADAYGFEYGKDWYRLPMGMDNFPSILLTPQTVEVLRKDIQE